MESRLNFMQWFVRYATPPLDPEIKKKKQHEKIKKRKKKKEKRKISFSSDNSTFGS
jgi:hypothetical protein